MSPEQARGETVDARTDVFALGLVLFQMATGRPAFSGATLATVFDAVSESHAAARINDRASVCPSRCRSSLRRRSKKIVNSGISASRICSADLQRIARWRGGFRHRPRRRHDGRRRRHGLLACDRVVSQGRSSRSCCEPAMDVVVARPAHSAVVSAGAGNPFARWLSCRSKTCRAAADTDYFTDGMTEELITALAAVRGWRVISRTSVMQYKHARKPLPVIAQELGVDAIVEGSIQQSANRVRITPNSCAPATQKKICGPAVSIMTCRTCSISKTNVARAIADEIKVTLTPQEQQRLAVKRPVDPEVFQLLLKGRAAAADRAQKTTSSKRLATSSRRSRRTRTMRPRMRRWRSPTKD